MLRISYKELVRNEEILRSMGTTKKVLLIITETSELCEHVIMRKEVLENIMAYQKQKMLGRRASNVHDSSQQMNSRKRMTKEVDGKRMSFFSTKKNGKLRRTMIAHVLRHCFTSF